MSTAQLSLTTPLVIRGRVGGLSPYLAGKPGRLVQDGDTDALREMGLAYYEFEAYRGSEIVCYSLAEAAELSESEGGNG